MKMSTITTFPQGGLQHPREQALNAGPARAERYGCRALFDPARMDELTRLHRRRPHRDDLALVPLNVGEGEKFRPGFGIVALRELDAPRDAGIVGLLERLDKLVGVDTSGLLDGLRQDVEAVI